MASAKKTIASQNHLAKQAQYSHYVSDRAFKGAMLSSDKSHHHELNQRAENELAQDKRAELERRRKQQLQNRKVWEEQ